MRRVLLAVVVVAVLVGCGSAGTVPASVTSAGQLNAPVFTLTPPPVATDVPAPPGVAPCFASAAGCAVGQVTAAQCRAAYGAFVAGLLAPEAVYDGPACAGSVPPPPSVGP